MADVLAPLLADHDATPLIVIPPDGLDLNAWALTDVGWATHLDHLGSVTIDHLDDTPASLQRNEIDRQPAGVDL